jgi:hypothetical protein
VFALVLTSDTVYVLLGNLLGHSLHPSLLSLYLS